MDDARFILLGETHGVQENLGALKLFIRDALNKHKKIVVGFEWPSIVTKEIHAFFSGGPMPNFSKWPFVYDEDGRFSREHVTFLKWAKETKRITIVAFDQEAKDWNKRDKKMADILMRAGSREVVIAIMGSLHASKSPFYLGRNIHIPLGSYLPSQSTVSIKFRYSSGYFYNGGLKKFSFRERKGGHKSKHALEKAKSSRYDYWFHIIKARPVHPYSKGKSAHI